LKTEILLKRSVVAVALTLASTHVVMAQDGAKPIQKVMVTGSNIRHVDAETASPVQVLKREDIERLGVNSVREALDTLTASDNVLSDLSGSNSFASGGTGASLRGLGKQSTLVLLNSRRVAPYALADYNEVFTNLDTLPISAVERIEVLKNGGSAIYGSDAVAGVINIITRSDYDGVVARMAHYQSTETSAFTTTTASITGGWGNLATDRYNILANVEVFQRNGVMWREVVDGINPIYGKKFSAVAEGSGQMFGNRGAPSTFSYPGNLIGQGALPGCTTKDASGLCVHDRFSRFQVQPAADRANALVAARFDLGNGLESYSELLYSHTKTEYQSAYNTYGSTTANTVWGDPRTNASKTFIYRKLPATHPLNTSGKALELRYRFSDAPSGSSAEGDQYRLLTGLKGNYKGYEWDSAAGIMGGKVTQRSQGSFSDSGFKQVIGDYRNANDPLFFNRDYKIGQQNSVATLNTLFPTYGYDGKTTHYFVDGKITGEIAQLNGRPVGVAAGGDVRHESFDISPTANLRAGDIVGNGASIAKAGRNAGSAFAEINVPLASKLELIGAGRVDKFGSFDAHFSPKVAARWEVAPQLLVRGTFETGFRAPNLTESAESTKFAFSNSVVDPKRCDQAQALAKDLRAAAAALPSTDPNKALLTARADIVNRDECATGVATITRNNPDLKPETSRVKSVGFVLEPVKGTSFTLDYWHIVRKDEIGIKDRNDLLASEDSLPKGVINRSTDLSNDTTFITPEERAKYGVTAGRLVSISGQFENVAKTRTHGIDFAFKSSFDTAAGRLTLDGNSTYLLNYQNWAPGLDAYGDNLAGRYGSPKLVANTSASLKTGNFTNSLRAVFEKGTSLNTDYFDASYTLKGCTAKGWTADECRIADYHRLDYTLKWTGIKNLTLQLYVRNIQNKRPPYNLRSFNASGGAVIPQSREDVQRRMVRVTAEYKFK
jgi:iron complex outermembrane recepter protein